MSEYWDSDFEMSDYWGIDFETFSKTNLPERGKRNYMDDPSFRAILVSVAPMKGLKPYNALRFELLYDDGLAGFEEFIRYVKDEKVTLIAQNAGFERGVLMRMGLMDRWDEINIVDSAVMARLLGAGSKLEVASRQLTDTPKLEAGKSLIMKFCVPHEGYDEPSFEYIEEHAEDWALFGDYCDVDAIGGREIVDNGIEILRDLGIEGLWNQECRFEKITAQMNETGWGVDREAVKWMLKRSWANSEIAKSIFIQDVGKELNFNSPIQLKKFCTDRGVKVSSLDKYHAPAKLQEVLEALEDPKLSEERRQQLSEVRTMLEIKLEIGGTSLSKLPVIDKTTREADDRLYDQYMHVGAGQTFRTTGVGVQMQNITRLKGELRDLETLEDYSVEWTNTDMINQLRQVFRSQHPEGELIVGDFKAVESRGLAFLAGEEWKLDAYREGMDIYKMLVTKYDDVAYEDVTSEMRPKGKYTELSCGYQASAKAVKEFMFRLGFNISLEEAQEWVPNWRNANPKIVELWGTLDEALREAIATRTNAKRTLGNGLTLEITPFTLPSVSKVAPGSVSLCIKIYLPTAGEPFVVRFIHGAEMFVGGKGISYHKPAETVREDGLWGKISWSRINKTATQKANQGNRGKRKIVLNTIYGGKLAGILTQSFCREMFFGSAVTLVDKIKPYPNVKLVGQFHDELNVEWVPSEEPNALELDQAIYIVEEAMSKTTVPGFPLAADVKSAYRYIK